MECFIKKRIHPFRALVFVLLLLLFPLLFSESGCSSIHSFAAEHGADTVNPIPADPLYAALPTDSGSNYSDLSGGTIYAALTEGSNSSDAALSSGLYSVASINEYSKYFTNNVDGYRLIVPQNAKIDMGMAEVRTVLETDSLRIEIYDQTLGGSTGFGYSSYVNYGAKMINDPSVYYVSYKGNMKLAGYNAHVTEWSRNTLATVTDDLNHYACVHLPISANRALTLFFKSSLPFRQDWGNVYVNIVNSLELTQKKAYAPGFKSSPKRNPYWNDETRAFFNEYFGPSASLEWGIYEPGEPIVDKVEFAHLEQAINHKFRFELFYSHMGYDLSSVALALQKAEEQGRTLELTFQTVANENGGNMVYDILNGVYDEYLNAYAKIVADSERPVLFRLGNEMNGDWCVYSAYNTGMDSLAYIRFYRYMHDIFERNGALKNTIWVWNPNDRSYPNFDWNHALCYYPGDELVDIVGLTGYNTGTYYRGEKWRSFKEIYDAFYYDYCNWFGQPLMITEFGCSAIGGDQSYWIGQMFLNIGNYSRIKVAIYWDGYDFDSARKVARHYSIKENYQSVQYFMYNLAPKTEVNSPSLPSAVEAASDGSSMVTDSSASLSQNGAASSSGDPLPMPDSISGKRKRYWKALPTPFRKAMLAIDGYR